MHARMARGCNIWLAAAHRHRACRTRQAQAALRGTDSLLRAKYESAELVAVLRATSCGCCSATERAGDSDGLYAALPSSLLLHLHACMP